METTNKNLFIEVDYELFVPSETGRLHLVEKTSPEHPFGFITGMGYALEAFEKNIANLPQGEKFEFDLSVEEAYGEYLQEHVIKLPKDIFNINGKFDEARIFPGNVIPLANEDGNHFEGIVKEILDDTVEIDLNHPLAGKPLHFKGTIITTRPATIEEMEKFVNDLNGDEDCECCQNKEQCGDHHGDCCHHDEGCQHGGCGCGHHHCH